MIKIVNTTKNKAFQFDLATGWEDGKDFNLVQIPLTGEDSSATKIISILGPTQTINIVFKLTNSQYDYTAGTGSPSSYSANEKRLWLLDEVCRAQCRYKIYDEEGNSYSGMITRLNISKISEKPLEFEGRIAFIIGQNIS